MLIVHPFVGRDGSEQDPDLDDGQDSELNSSFAFDNGATPGDVVRTPLVVNKSTKILLLPFQ